MSASLDNLDLFAERWHVSIKNFQETHSSILGFGERNGFKVVLKISKQMGDESNSGEVLRAFMGDGSVRVLEASTGAVLLERLDPGKQLVSLVRRGGDDEAIDIIAEVMTKLRDHPPPAVCPTVADWARAFDRYLQSHDQQIARDLIEEAQHIFQQLVSSQTSTMLLHGDLQHYNVLLDDKRGWVALDPKGVVGELEFEIGPLLRNPIELPEFVLKTTTIERRLDLLAAKLNLNYQRTVNWAFSQSVLSAVWDIEDGFAFNDENISLRLAQALRPMLP